MRVFTGEDAEPRPSSALVLRRGTASGTAHLYALRRLAELGLQPLALRGVEGARRSDLDDAFA